MRNIIYKNIIVDPGEELSPSIKIHPFQQDYLITTGGDILKSKLYLEHRFGNYKIFKKGRDALYAALNYYNLSKNDTVTILTTSQNFYISKCVTNEVDKICKWNRNVTEETKVIIFNHEFGYPYRNMKEVANYGLPIIEDCAHTFYDNDSEIGLYSDFVVYSLPKAFPMQMGGMLKTNVRFSYIGNFDVESYVLNNLSKHVDRIDEYAAKRLYNIKYFSENLESIGIQPYFVDDKAVPGTFLFKWNKDIDYPVLKKYMYANGVECSVFYGKNAFFLPIHQELRKSELDYMISLLYYFNEYTYE